MLFYTLIEKKKSDGHQRIQKPAKKQHMFRAKTKFLFILPMSD